MDGRKLHARWKSATSDGNKPERHSLGGEVSRDDASSVHMSDTGLEGDNRKSFDSEADTRSLINPNSAAVPHKQDARGVRDGRRRDSMGNLASSDARRQTSLAGSTIDVKGKESKFSEEFNVRKRVSRNNIQSACGNTSANERMSMVDFLNTTDSKADPNKRMSEIDLVGAVGQKLVLDMEK